MRSGRCFATIALLFALTSGAQASPWAEVGDPSLRSDIEVLAAAHVIDGITTQWPLPWASLVTRLNADGALAGQPTVVRDAAAHVLAAAQDALGYGELKATVSLDAASAPSVVRGFDGLGRETIQGQVSAEYMTPTTAIRVSLGGESAYHGGRTKILLDNSYIAQRVGSAVVYAGYLPHWWGPGWISALSLSNNARPMPQIGIARGETEAFESPWLSWIGPWQGEFFVGVLDDPRIAKNTIYSGLRFTFNPFPGLEIGLARTDEVCGTGHPCKPLAYYFEFSNDPSHVNHTNDEGVIDVKYTTLLGNYPFEAYLQLMNEDSSPISHSGTSHLFGTSIWLPMDEGRLRLTLEYSDSVPTVDIFSFGDVLHGFAYNNGGYPDGMRYRGRSLGFSLDSDSTLLTLQAGLQGSNGWFYELSFHHAALSNPNNTVGNVVTTAPVHVNMAEARVSFPWERWHVDLAGRLADDQPRPWHGFQAAIEASLNYAL
ncbi:MAG: hypothetical protein JSR60_13960 [Proteobacteria bacterium]|nr:hypothetical protein [Pseudomonadota bacterium]